LMAIIIMAARIAIIAMTINISMRVKPVVDRAQQRLVAFFEENLLKNEEKDWKKNLVLDKSVVKSKGLDSLLVKPFLLL